MSIKVNDIDLRTLSLFTRGYDKTHYIREVQKMLGASSRTALLTLRKLEQLGFLESKTMGKIKAYSIRRAIGTREAFILAEQYKKIAFMQKNPLIKEIIERTETYMSGIIIIFGSYAKGLQTKYSDIDILIVGRHDKKAVRGIGRTYGIEISIKEYPTDIFGQDIKDDILLSEVAESHIIVRGIEDYVARILKWTSSDGAGSKRKEYA